MRTIIKRAGWNARPPKQPFTNLRPNKVVGIVLHHSGVQNAEPGPATLKAFERTHMDTRGWNAIAYNWLVDANGVIYEGRGAGIVGGATKGWNSRTESVCYTGWGSGPIPDAALKSIRWVMDEIQKRYNNKLWIKGHRDMASTSCPGSELYAWLQNGRVVDNDPKVTDPGVDWAAVAAYVDALGADLARKPLKRRSRGKAVELAQRQLKDKGYDPGPIDGVYGGLTVNAVKGFQRNNGLKMDGVVGSFTWRALFS
jgi:hypothetical protein